MQLFWDIEMTQTRDWPLLPQYWIITLVQVPFSLSHSYGGARSVR